jgi:hypothetical protein
MTLKRPRYLKSFHAMGHSTESAYMLWLQHSSGLWTIVLNQLQVRYNCISCVATSLAMYPLACAVYLYACGHISLCPWPCTHVHVEMWMWTDNVFGYMKRKCCIGSSFLSPKCSSTGQAKVSNSLVPALVERIIPLGHSA